MKLSKLGFIVPADVNRPTGGNIYDLFLHAAMVTLGHDMHMGSEAFVLGQSPDTVIVDAWLHRSIDIRAFKARGIKLIALVHTPRFILEPTFGEEDRKKEIHFLSSMDGLIFVSRSTAQKTLPSIKGNGPQIILPPGRDNWSIERLDPSLQLKPRVFHILNIGRFESNKRQYELLKLLIHFRDLRPDLPWHLHFVGDQNHAVDYFFAVKSLAKKASLHDIIHFHGELPRLSILKTFQESHLYICSSLYESWGMAVAEAMGAGLPALNFSTGGCQELLGIQDKPLYNFDAPSRFLNHLTLLMTDWNFYQKISASQIDRFFQLDSWKDTAARLSIWLSKHFKSSDPSSTTTPGGLLCKAWSKQTEV